MKDSADFSTASGDSAVTLNGKVNFLVGDTTVKANSSTIFLVLDADDELTVYTGVKSIPDIILKNGNAHVEYIAKSTGYAGFVFIEVNGTSTVVGGDESSDIVYVVKYDAKKITVDNEVYYTFKVLDENGDTTKVKSQDRDIFGGEGVKDYYSAFYKIRTDSDGYITSAPAVPNSGKYVAKSGTKLVFTYSDNTLYVQDDSGKWVSFIEGDDAEINLIVTGDAKAALNKDTGADYEASMGISLKTLGAVLEGYQITGSYAGVVTEAGSEELTTLYVTVTNAVVPAPAEEAGE